MYLYILIYVRPRRGQAQFVIRFSGNRGVGWSRETLRAGS